MFQGFSIKSNKAFSCRVFVLVVCRVSDSGCWGSMRVV